MLVLLFHVSRFIRIFAKHYLLAFLLFLFTYHSSCCSFPTLQSKSIPVKPKKVVFIFINRKNH